MAWAEKRDDSYHLYMTDGIISKAPVRQHGLVTAGKSMEQVFVERLYRYERRLNVNAERRARRAPFAKQLHLWLIGDDGWINHAPKPFPTIADNEQDPDYRLLVIGQDLTDIPGPYLQDWTTWLRQSGMRSKTTHNDLEVFRSLCYTIIEPIHDTFIHTHEPPTSVLEALEVPVTFYGDLATYNTMED